MCVFLYMLVLVLVCLAAVLPVFLVVYDGAILDCIRSDYTAEVYSS
jgi:hypothetical protein